MSRTETPAKERLLQALVEAGPAGASREHLVQVGGVSPASVYRVLRPLLERGLVTERQGAYVMPLTLEHNYRYKLFHDMERLYELPPEIRCHVLDLVEQIQGELKDQLLALWLIGSAAHGQLKPESDLDFLGVVRKDTLWFPRSSRREVQFITFTPRHFQAAFEEGDPFILAALQAGLLLVDRGFAQPWLSRVPPESGPRDSEIWGRLERKLLFLLKEQADSEAHTALRGLAVELARGMLSTLGEIPAGKAEMLALCRLLLGETFTETLEQSLGDLDRKGLMQCFDRLSDYRHRWMACRKAWESSAALLRASGPELEALAAPLIENLAGGEVALACKSLHRGLTLEQVEQVAHALQARRGLPVLLVNAYRQVPLLHRPPAGSEEVRLYAQDMGLHLWESAQLLRAQHCEDLGDEWQLPGLKTAKSPKPRKRP